MSISINNNLLSLNVANTFNKNTVGLQNSMNALSTGQKINYAGDDPSGMGISERLRTRAQSLEQANKNVQNDSTILKIADNALSNIAEIITSMREKVVQASDSNLNDTDRAVLSAGVEQLRTQIDNIANKDAKYNGHTFYATQTNDGNGYRAKNFTVHWGADSGDNWDIDFEAMDATSLGLTAAATSTLLATTTDAPSTSAGVLTTIDTALAKVAKEQSKLGTYEQRLGYLSDRAVNERSAIMEMDSLIRDTDVAQGMSEFMKYNIRTQTSQLMLAQAGQVPAMVLQLLQP